jgi:uncharacterized membrane protein YedE/YeeE
MAFTPVASLLGGVLIGASASGLLVLKGRVAGISGMLGGLVWPRVEGDKPDDGPGERGERPWRLAFIAGLAAGGAAFACLRPSLVPRMAHVVGLPWLVVAGLLVGFGTQLGSGCTSGHGVCGISRLSTRSIVATATFMLTGVVATYAAQHLFHLGQLGSLGLGVSSP